MFTDKILDQILPIAADKMAKSYSDLIKLLMGYGFDEQHSRDIADRGIKGLKERFARDNTLLQK